MKLPTVRDFYREALEQYQDEFEESCGFWERPNRGKRLELLTDAQAKWGSMMEAYGEWQPKKPCPICGGPEYDHRFNCTLMK